MKQILLVEDEQNFGAVLRDYLGMHDFSVRWVQDGKAGLNAFRNGDYGMCILDVMMPKMDGFHLAEEIRKHNAAIPIIFLTARSMKEDVHKGFRVGADDYLTKPFDSEELLLRIRAILKRTTIADSPVTTAFPEKFHVGSYRFIYRLHSLSRGEQTTKLSPKEADLLRLLCLHQNDLLSREETLRQLWGDDNYFNARSMDVFISKLRKRLQDDSSIRIENVHGKGFRLVCEVSKT